MHLGGGHGTLGSGLLGAVLLLAGCAPEAPEPGSGRPAAPGSSQSGIPRQPSVPAPAMIERASGPRPTDGRAASARMSIPDLGVAAVQVVPYRGRTDDARGTQIQDGGALASPHGPQGGVGPGGVGNYQVTGHRLSSTQVFRELPRLARGARVMVESRGRRLEYRIVATRKTSFRSPGSLREQRAPVPGRPGVEPRRAMITLSTCATVEDHAAGNFWADRFGNPEHRIDKIGVLVAAPAG